MPAPASRTITPAKRARGPSHRCDPEAIGRARRTAHYGPMKRIRALAAVLGCLAVLASGVITVAAAAVPSGAPATERNGASAPCSHCDDCDGVPCPMPLASCLQAATAAPTLVPTTIDLPPLEAAKVHWSLRTTILSGLSPPPDPFPPRA